VENTARVTLTIAESGDHIPQSAKSIVGSDLEVVIPLEGLVDIEAERVRIAKEIGKTEKEIAFVSKKLGNANFVERAPPDVVEENRERLIAEQERKALLQEALEALK
jgi:valyl-tRNA synthetase